MNEEKLKAALFSTLKIINPMLQPSDITVTPFTPQQDSRRSRASLNGQAMSGMQSSEVHGVRIMVGGAALGADNIAAYSKCIRDETEMVCSHNARDQLNFFGSAEQLERAVSRPDFRSAVSCSTKPISRHM